MGVFPTAFHVLSDMKRHESLKLKAMKTSSFRNKYWKWGGEMNSQREIQKWKYWALEIRKVLISFLSNLSNNCVTYLAQKHVYTWAS
jgi:hypothetical protein